ncbi:MAG: CARDB domain-containing protein [Dehalococcoidales bacterium]
MPKGILSVIILFVTLLAFSCPLFCPVNYTDTVARAESGPDLTIEAITSSPETPSLGDDVTFTISISNRGTATSGQCYVAYYIDDDYVTNDYVSAIAPDASAEYTFTWAAEAGIHTFTAVADYKGQVNESDEYNNEKTYTLSTLGADLIIDSITWSPSEPAVGSTVIFTISIKNQGTDVAISSRVHFYIEDVPQGFEDGERISPGETQTRTFSWFTKAGLHEIKAIADKNDSVPEIDEGNNEMTVVFSSLLPDLIIDDISWSPETPSIGDSVIFTVNVTNQGSAASGLSIVDFYINDTHSDTGEIDGLEPSASGNATFSWFARTGTNVIKAIVTSGGILTESDKTNNEKTVTLSPNLADLIVHSITWSPAEPSVRDNITFTVTVENQGSGDSDESRVDLYIDGNSTGYRTLEKIDAGDEKQVTFTWRAEEGSHQIQAVVDWQDDVPESEESNNEKTVTFSISPPDLIVEQIAWAPPEPAIGDKVTFTVTVKNQGESGSDYAHIAYFIDDDHLSSGYVNPISANATDNMTFAWTATAGEHAIRAFIDFTGIVTESDEANNEKVSTLVPLGPDLIIKSIDWSHNDPAVGETVTFTVIVENDGSNRAGSSLLHIYIDNNPRGYQDIPAIDPGTTVPRTFDWKVEEGLHTIRAVVDDSNLVAETSEKNNETLIVYPVPDLTFEAVTWSPVNPLPGDKVTLTAYVKNKGSRGAGSFRIYFYIDDEVVDYQEIPQLDAGARVTKDFEWDAAIGPHTLTLFADGADAIVEGVESNNSETVAFSIPAPDLTIESINWPSGEPPTGDEVVFTVTIRNQGDANAGYSSLSYYVDGKYLASSQISTLEPDAKTEESFSTWISQVGPHTIRVIIDEGNRVSESNEGNNEKVVAFSTENVTSASEPAPKPAPDKKTQPRPAPIPLAPEEEDYKAEIMFGIVVIIFGGILLFTLYQAFRKK